MEPRHEDNETAVKVLAGVLEQMAFLFAEIVEKTELPDSCEDAVQACMGFRGPVSGTLSLAVPQSMCPVIAENMLGVEPDDERVMEKAQDALKEVLNVTCGNFLTEIAGEEPVFNLTIPEVTVISADEWLELVQSDATEGLLVDEFPLIISVEREG
jgi:chemotaxis protein CheY-P-specific phosphatase CheC